MLNKITKRSVDAVLPETGRDLWVWDSEVKGFGLRVKPSGHKAYILEYRPGEGGRIAPKRRYTIGTHGSPWTPDAARDEAKRLLHLVSQGRDPSVERSAARAGEGETVAELSAAFVEKYASRKQKSWRETERALRRDIIPKLGHKRLSEVTRLDIVRVLDGVAERGPVMANRTLAYTRRLFNWAIERGYAAENPCSGLKSFAVNASRDRVLSDSELAEVWRACGRINGIWSRIVRLLIVTAQRRSEVSGMCWPEVDLENRLWTIPAVRAKNKRAHEVALTETAITLLTGTPKHSVKDEKGFLAESQFVFTTTGLTPFSGFSKSKRRLDQEILAVRRSLDPDADPIPVWTLHDLRRTATTGLARLGVHPHIADALLNHRGGTIKGVASIYNRYAYAHERRQALERWEAHVLSIVSANVGTDPELRDDE